MLRPYFRPHSHCVARGFTLIEMLVCIAIIAVLIALLLPAVQAAREAARRSQCKNNLFELGIALHNYHDAHRTFPPGYVSAVGSSGQDLGPGWGWAAMLLPFVEQSNIWHQISFDQPARSPVNSTATNQVIELFLCPSDWSPGPGVRYGNYVGCFGRGSVVAFPDRGDGVFFRNSRIRMRDIEDGPMTILLGERAELNGVADWAGIFDEQVFTTKNATAAQYSSNRARVLGHTGPVPMGAANSSAAKDSNESGEESRARHPAQHSVFSPRVPAACPFDFGGWHIGGSHFLFVDGSVRILNPSVDATVYAGLATRAGGELVNETDF